MIPHRHICHFKFSLLLFDSYLYIILDGIPKQFVWNE
jgi:hypothetical protein